MAEDETDPRSLSAAETVSHVLHDTPGPSDPEKGPAVAHR